MPENSIQYAVKLWEEIQEYASDSITDAGFSEKDNPDFLPELHQKLKKDEMEYDELIHELANNQMVIDFIIKEIKSNGTDKYSEVYKQRALHIIYVSQNKPLWDAFYNQRDIGFLSRPFSRPYKVSHVDYEPIGLLSNKDFNALWGYILARPLPSDNILKSGWYPPYLLFSQHIGFNHWHEHLETIIKLQSETIGKRQHLDWFLSDALGYLGDKKAISSLEKALAYHQNQKEISYIRLREPASNLFMLNGIDDKYYLSDIAFKDDNNAELLAMYGGPDLLDTYINDCIGSYDLENNEYAADSKASDFAGTVGSLGNPKVIPWLFKLLCNDNERIRRAAHVAILNFLPEDAQEQEAWDMVEEMASSQADCKRLSDYWKTQEAVLQKHIPDKSKRYYGGELFDVAKIFKRDVYQVFDEPRFDVTGMVDQAIHFTGHHLPYNPYAYWHIQLEQIQAWIDWLDANPFEAGRWILHGKYID